MTSLIHLRAVIRFKMDRLIKDIEQHAIDWCNKKRCNCVVDDKIIECKHLLNDRNKKFEKKINKIHKQIGGLGSVTILNLNK